jgi:S-layer family protein
MLLGFSNTNHSFFATEYNSTPLGFQLASNAHNQLMLNVEQVRSSSNDYSVFLWVSVWWRRTVSPAPAVASFVDVPTSDPFFQYIEALKASGITAGCIQSPPKFCPDEALTRGQMAVFLAKALGLHWPDF